MKNSIHTLAYVLFGASLLFGCGDEQDLAGDSAEASFGGKSSKADGRFSECQLRETLNFVNESTTTAASLSSRGINRRAAENIIAHRNGPDGQLGNGDDDLFDDLDELDAISYVGPVTLQQLVDVVADRCVAVLSGRPFIDSTTFGSSIGGGFTRDNVELEAVMTLNGITGSALHEILRSTDSRDRTVFSRMRRSQKMEGLTYSYSVDEVPWNNASMEARAAFPYVALTIESGRFEPVSGGKRELSLGTDIMDDTYYDTQDFTLLEHDMTLRGRVRWDTETVVRRLLIGAKFGSIINAEGIKEAAKIDVRTEGGRHVPTLDENVRSGMVPWSGQSVPIKPVEEVYLRLVGADALPDIEGREKVLLLNPRVHIRSVRSRYHLNEAGLNHIQNYHRNGYTRIGAVVEYLQNGVDAGTIDLAVAGAAIEMGTGILDGTLVQSTAAPQLQALGADNTDVVMPDRFTRPTTQVELDKQQVVSETVDALMTAFSTLVDDIDRSVTGTSGLSGDDFVDTFIAWQVSQNSTLAQKTTFQPFLERYNAALPTDAMAQFNDFGQQQRDVRNRDFEDFEPIDAANWTNLGKHLEYEWLKVSYRMIRAAAIASNALWFDMARQFYVPGSNRSSFSNFIIDTIDYTEMVTQPEWESIPEAQRNPAHAIDPAKIFHTSLVNEVQIELGSEEPYVRRLDELKTLIEADPDNEDLKRQHEGARFVFKKYHEALSAVAEIKGPDIIDRVRDEGGPRGMSWDPGVFSKGETALQKIRH